MDGLPAGKRIVHFHEWDEACQTQPRRRNCGDINHADFQTNLDSHSDSQPLDSSNQHDDIHLVKDGCDEAVQTKYKNDVIISELVTLISASQADVVVDAGEDIHIHIHIHNHIHIHITTLTLTAKIVKES